MSGVHRPLVGLAWMMGAVSIWTASGIAIMYLDNRVPATDLSFYRAVTAVFVLLPFIVQAQRRGELKPPTTRGYFFYLLRGALIFFGQFALYYAIPLIPLAESTVLNCTSPLFIAFLAPFLLGEKVDRARWVAIGLGFAGVIVIMRPGLSSISVAAMMAIASSLAFGLGAVVNRIMSRTETAGRVVFYTNVTVVVLAAIPFAAYAVVPRWSDMPLVAAICVMGVVAHYCTARAVAEAEASFVGPFEFMRVPLAALFGIVLFGQTPTVWLAAGSLLILAGIVILARGGRGVRPA